MENLLADDRRSRVYWIPTIPAEAVFKTRSIWNLKAAETMPTLGSFGACRFNNNTDSVGETDRVVWGVG